MQSKRNLIISAVGVIFISIVFLRDYILTLAIMLMYAGITILPVIFIFAFIGVVGYFGYKYLVNNKLTPNTPNLNKNAQPKELSEDLMLAFKRNNMRQLQYALAKLPTWPITQHIQQTAQELVELKRSVYRAQAEGVPASMIERYLQNMNQAAETVWQLASKVDAVGLQNIGYQIVAPRLHQEEIKLQQLQDAIKASHEGIALLILSGTTSNLLQDVEEDLRALTTAIKRLEDVHTRQNLT